MTLLALSDYGSMLSVGTIRFEDWSQKGGMGWASLIPGPHPLTRRTGLVNQVEFLGLAGALAQCNLATFKYFAENPLKKGTDTRMEK